VCLPRAEGVLGERDPHSSETWEIEMHLMFTGGASEAHAESFKEQIQLLFASPEACLQ
jgi:hypothetical protein